MSAVSHTLVSVSTGTSIATTIDRQNKKTLRVVPENGVVRSSDSHGIAEHREVSMREVVPNTQDAMSHSAGRGGFVRG
jgi:hypothetical protein